MRLCSAIQEKLSPLLGSLKQKIPLGLWDMRIPLVRCPLWVDVTENIHLDIGNG